MATHHYDVVIIGSGAGGGTLAWKLASSGKRILLLERGDYLPRERDNWDTEQVFLRGKYLTTEKWRDASGHTFTPEQNYNVGGNTKFYGAALFRLRPEDFGELQHHGGISPAWPVGYQDFEPWYAEAEQLYFVHGAAKEDPTDGPRTSDFPYPAVQHEPRIQQLHDDLERLGLHPSHLPIGVMLDQDEHGNALHSSKCIRCDRVDGFPCLVDAKADAQTVCVDPALQHSNVELVTNARVDRLETDADGRTVSAVVATLADGSEARFAGDVVVDADPVVGMRQVLRRDPEVDGMFGERVEGLLGHELGAPCEEVRRLAAELQPIGLAEHLDAAPRVVSVLSFEIPVVEDERLLEPSPVWFLRQGHHRDVVVTHVIASDLIGTIRQTLGVCVIRGSQQQRRRINGPARRDDDIGRVGLPRAGVVDVDLRH